MCPEMTGRRRVLMLCPTFLSVGGIGEYARHVVTAFEGVDVDVLGYARTEREAPVPSNARIIAQPDTKVGFVAHLARLLVSTTYDSIVTAHVGLMGALALTPVRGSRVFLMLHGREAWARLPHPPRRSWSVATDVVSTTLFTR